MKNLYIIDAYNLVYRMFYAIPEMHTRTGEQVNAIFWVIKFIKSLSDWWWIDRLVVASESGSNFRSTLFAEYKGTRDRMPDNLRSQIAPIFEFFELAKIPVIVREWYEADDVIGSLARHTGDHGEMVIISSDKDLCQFVEDGKVRIFDAMKQKNLRRADVVEKFWLPPEQVVDYLSIVGDTSDNIPGIAGFGPKKAVDLLTKYGTLSGIYEHISDLTPKMQETLMNQKENAFLSQKLASIVTDLSIDDSELWNEWFDNPLIFPEVIEFLKKYEFKSLIPRELQEQKKELSIEKIIQIHSISELEAIKNNLKSTSVLKRVFLSSNQDGIIVFWVESHIYRIDTKIVDSAEFIEFLLTSPVLELIWFDLKDDMKRLLWLQKSLQWVEGQGRLF